MSPRQRFTRASGLLHNRGRAAALIVTIAVATAVGSGASVSATDVDPPKARVAMMTATFVDQHRSTSALPGTPAQPRRVLRTTVRYPATSAHGLPLIVVAHGLNGSPHQLDELLTAWAAAGYVVAAPTLPRVNVDRRGKAVLADAAQYPADLSFVVDQLVAMSRADATGPLRGTIDARDIGVAGVSLGGMSVYGLISNTCCRDSRIRAGILMSAVHNAFPDGRYERQHVPVLLVHGDADVGYHHSTDAYPQLAPPKWFITLRRGRHGPPFEDETDEHDDLVRVTTIAFWDRYLKADRSGATRIVDAVAASHGAATLVRDLR